MLTCSKKYDSIPFGHRAPRHDGHCRLLHGHDMAVEFTFAAHQRDENGFIVDFGKVKYIKEWLEFNFDHKLLIAADDPEIPYFEDMNLRGLCDLRVIPGTSAEHIAEYIFEHVTELLKLNEGKRVWLTSVRVWEDTRNSALIIR